MFFFKAVQQMFFVLLFNYFKLGLICIFNYHDFFFFFAHKHHPIYPLISTLANRTKSLRQMLTAL